MTDLDLRILLVEDDDQIRLRLRESLESSGCSVHEAGTVFDARGFLNRSFDLILLDLGLPDQDGFDLCRELRRQGDSTPIIILTARDATEHRIRGLDLGADDYMVKPFSLDELYARMRAVMRRVKPSLSKGRVENGELWAEPDTREAGRGSHRCILKPREFDLLVFLMRHPGRVWTRDQLLDRVWGTEGDGETRTVDLHVRRLRAQVEIDPSDPLFIQTVWGVGYRMNESP